LISAYSSRPAAANENNAWVISEPLLRVSHVYNTSTDPGTSCLYVAMLRTIIYENSPMLHWARIFKSHLQAACWNHGTFRMAISEISAKIFPRVRLIQRLFFLASKLVVRRSQIGIMPRAPSKPGASVRQHITTACTACRRSKIKVITPTLRGSNCPLIGHVVRRVHPGVWTVPYQES
jgi:hypothetical protein